MKVFIVLLLCSALLGSAFQDLPERARGGKAYKDLLARSKTDVVKAAQPLIYTSSLDNFNSANNATFAQRYYVNDEFWTPGSGPVFFLISGEGTCNGPPGGYVASLGAQYKALLVTLEHRFYGESIPTGGATTENYAYLTVEQALADLAKFTQFYQKNVPTTQNVPWVIFGGSYSGGLSSWYRSAYPELSVGALSSSGVVNTIIDFYQFDQQISASAGNECGNKIKTIQSAFARTISTGPAGLQTALSKLSCEKDMSATDFYFTIADSWSMGIQYGGKTHMCETFAKITEDSSDDVIMDVFAEWSKEYWGADFCAGGFYNTKSLADPARWDVNSRSWRYQTCAQVSYFNTAPRTGSLRSTELNMQYHLQQCKAVFGINMFPASMKMVAIYGGQFPKAEKVFYSDFSDDPWQRASVWFSPSTSQPYHLGMCDDCGHCMDLHAPSETDPAPLVEGRKQFEGYLAQWIKQ